MVCIFGRMRGMLRRFLALALGLAAAVMLPAAAQQAAKKAAPAAKKKSAAAAPGPESALNKKHLEAYLRHVYGWLPQVKVEVGDFTPAPVRGMLQTTVRASYQLESQEKVFLVSSDGKYIFDGALYEAADNPFRSNLNKITTALQPSFGAPGASVVIVDYSDFQCPHCREEAKVLRENILKTYPTQVRVYFKDYPLSNHDWARTAAMAGHCIFKQNPAAFWDYHDWIFDKQAEVTSANFRDKLNEFVKGKQIDPLQLNRCLDKRETEGEVDKSIAEGRSVGVTSTPTLFVNGRRLAGAMPWPNLKQIIDLEIDYQKVAKNAGEADCCVVRLPSAVPNP
jgi:protein-disulfide isomerase